MLVNNGEATSLMLEFLTVKFPDEWEAFLRHQRREGRFPLTTLELLGRVMELNESRARNSREGGDR